MTRKEIREFLANTKVYVNGKSVEIQEKLFKFGYLWPSGDQIVSNANSPFLYIQEDGTLRHGDLMLSFTSNNKREITAEQILALELTEPTYRPFKNIEECWQEMQKHKPFGWVIHKEEKCYMVLASIYPDEEFKKMLSNCNFADGTPFGIKEE